MIDVSLQAVASGMVASVCETILANIDNLTGDSRRRVAFITYDNTIHFYNLKVRLPRIDSAFHACARLHRLYFL